MLSENQDKTTVIGTHGTALSSIINYYDKNFGYEQFAEITGVMPWIVKMTFRGEICTGIQR